MSPMISLLSNGKRGRGSRVNKRLRAIRAGWLVMPGEENLAPARPPDRESALVQHD
jgi:hypothetical protein